jgi:hypothetical protein
MTKMDHNEAVRLQAAEKYLLGELPKEQHAAYEEHYFDCHACAEELKATVAFLESARQVVRKEIPQTIEDKNLAPAISLVEAWFNRLLRPAFAVPVFAALLLFIGYQNSVTIPQLKESSSSRLAQIVSSSFHLTGSVRGGSEAGETVTKVQVHSGESFILDFDFTPGRAYSAYRWELQDQTGRVIRQGILAGEKTNQAVRLAVLGGVEQAGKYNLVFFGGVNDDSLTTIEVQRLAFAVEFLK